MKQVYGFRLTLSGHEHGLWYDHDRRKYNPKGWGCIFEICVGQLLRPCFGKGNPWKDGKHWFVLRIPIFIGFFFSLAIGQFGIYFGTKTYKVDHTDTHYRAWIDPKDFPAGFGVEYEYLCPSATIRKTRWR